MGLLYLFPVSLEEQDHVILEPSQNEGTHKLTLKSYGLPGVFWFYLLASLGVIFLMFLLINNPLQAIIRTGDPLNIFLGRLVYFTLFSIPLGLLGLFFFQKRIIREGRTLQMHYHLFGIPIRKKSFHLMNQNAFFIKHFLDSPNKVRIQQTPGMQQYMNKGHFELWARQENDRTFLVDRHSRKADLVHLQNLLESSNNISH